MQLAINNSKQPFHHQKAQRFTMWIGLASLTMMFAAFTSAYIVRKGAGNWVEFGIPPIFYTSTLLIFLSSVTMYIAHTSNKRANKRFLRLGLLLTFLLGTAFCVSQYRGWLQLRETGIYLDGNVSGSFFYVITYAHFAHVAVGLLLLLVAFIRSVFVLKKVNTGFFHDEAQTQFRIRTDLLSMYWHFVGLLWIYLFIFLSINHQN